MAMYACVKCGRRHADVEAIAGRQLYCADIDAYWLEVRRSHKEHYGHRPDIATDSKGQWECTVCGRQLLVPDHLHVCPEFRLSGGEQKDNDPAMCSGVYPLDKEQKTRE